MTIIYNFINSNFSKMFSNYNENKNFLVTTFYITTYITCCASFFIILDAYYHSVTQLIYISILITLTLIKPLTLYLFAFNVNYHFSCLRCFQNSENINTKYIIFLTLCDTYFITVIYALPFFSETVSSDESLFFKVIVALTVFADYLIFLNVFSGSRSPTPR
jgi:hypothetical protein